MSTIASPRPSITLTSASRRGSTSTDTTITSTTASTRATVERGSLRRNRNALRDYYNLAAATDSTTTLTTDADLPLDEPAEITALDQPSFDAASHVTHLLATEGLQGILRAEAALVTSIRALDGEKKALVYDNYSKLIAATETIRKMRDRMDPLTPATSTLTPAISHIAERAKELRGQMERAAAEGGKGGNVVSAKREGARWVVEAPARLEETMARGEKDEAMREWESVKAVLEKLEGVKGVEEVRRKCLAVVEAEQG